jgi:hypothetical protein
MVAYQGLPETDPNALSYNVDTAFASVTSEEIIIDTTNRVIALKVQGTLDEDGVTLKAFYSAVKDAWQGDTGGPGSSNRLIKFPFPFNPITDEQYEVVRGWTFDKTNTSGTASQTTEELIRTGGWQVVNTADLTTEQWINVISLGSLGTTDQVYYERGYKNGGGGVSARTPENTVLTDIVNQGVQVFASLGARTDVAFQNSSGNISTTAGDVSPFTVGDKILVSGAANGGNNGVLTVTAVDTTNGNITVSDTLTDEAAGATVTIVADYRKYFKIFCREWQKTYAQSSFEDIGIDTSTAATGATFQAYRFPLTNATDPDIPSTLAETALATGGVGLPDQNPYANVTIDYLRDNNGNVFVIKQDVAGTTAYKEGEVVYYPTDGNWYNVVADFTTVASPDPSTDSANFTQYAGQRDVGGVNYPFTVIIDGDTTVAAAASGTNNLAVIYRSVQYQLRQDENYDIDTATGVTVDGTQIGKVADELLGFVGPTLVTTQGVYIDSFSSTDNNDITMTTTSNIDGSSTTVSFPFKAQITINFGDNLRNDSDAKYYLFFTNANGNQYGTSSAIIVQDAEDPVANIAGNVSGASSVTRSFDYTNNTQGGRTADTPAPVTAVGIGLNTGQFVSATTTIQESTTNAVSLVAAFERNYTV